MLHTAIDIMVRHSVRDMISTLQTMQIVTIIPTSIVDRILVNTLPIMSGQEEGVSAQVR